MPKRMTRAARHAPQNTLKKGWETEAGGALMKAVEVV